MKKAATASTWIPELRGSGKPAYVAIADAIADDVHAGRLNAAEQLPPQRLLARQLGLNYTTISRAYAEAQRRGLIYSRVGQGSFVCLPSNSRPARSLRQSSNVDMTMNLPPEPDRPDLRERMRQGLQDLGGDLQTLLRYHKFGGSPEDKDAALQWLALRGLTPSHDQVLVCPGVQNSLHAVLSMLSRPGDVVLCEALTYPGLRAIAAQLGVRLVGLPMDAEGIELEPFAKACAEHHPKALYCNPTLLNPTTTVVSASRRQALIQVVRRHSVPIIEDDPYGLLPNSAPIPFARLAPDLTYHLSGLSKYVGAGLRVAFVIAPTPRHAVRLALKLRATSVMASPITVALATHWIQDGTAQAYLDAVRAESAYRQTLARDILGGAQYESQSEAFHLWLSLPEPWNRAAFASRIRAHNINVVVSDAFVVTHPAPEAVRVCLGGATTRAEIRYALELIADALDHPASVDAGFF